jgi:hypothetical protein
MPQLLFRSYVCEGLGRKDDDRVARTSSSYLRLELAQALTEDEQVVREAVKSCQLKIPQTPLVPYTEPTVYDGALLSQ